MYRWILLSLDTTDFPHFPHCQLNLTQGAKQWFTLLMASLCKVGCDFSHEDILTLFSGITGGFGGDRRVEYIIPHNVKVEGYHEFVIESSCNGMFGVPWNGDTIQPPDVYIVHQPYVLELNFH